MTAEEYVKRIRKIDIIVKNKLRDHARWVGVAEGLGGASVGEKVQSSRNLYQIPNAIGNYIDIEGEIKALERERQEIIHILEKLPTCEYEVLYMLYVQEDTLKEVAYHFGRSYEWAKAKKRKALRLLQDILDKKGG